jgi:DNA recombination protein RmuC
MFETIVLIGALIIACGIVVFVIDRKLKQLAKSLTEQTGLTLINQNMQGMQQRLDAVSSGLNTRLDNAARVIGEVNKELGHVQEIGRSLRDVQNFLQSPKVRGTIGEQVLEQLLQQAFPRGSFALQYRFKRGDIADAIIKTDQGIIPIDAKFPLTNFTALVKAETEAQQVEFRKLFVRDVRKQISDIAKKYIIPDEGTLNFALMYVPAEAIYYEIIRDESDLTAYAQSQNVWLVSPNGFYYFLKVILLGMQGQQIELQAKRILSTLQGLQKEMDKFGEELGVLQTHVTNAHNALDRVTSEYQKLNAKIDQIELLQ